MSGIFRDVTLVSRAPLHVRDFQVQTPFDAAYENSTFKLHVSVQNLQSRASRGRPGGSQASRCGCKAGIHGDEKGKYSAAGESALDIQQPVKSRINGPPSHPTSTNWFSP